MAELYWLKRPIAHRGLHDAAKGSSRTARPRSAPPWARAMASRSTCNAPRTTCRSCSTTRARPAHSRNWRGRRARRRGAVRAFRLRDSKDTILSLPALLTLVNGFVPLVLEVKSTWRRDGKFETNIAQMLASYKGPVAVMSFDPYSLKAFRETAPLLPRGLVADRFDDQSHWSHLTLGQRIAMRTPAQFRHRLAQLHRLRYRCAAGARAARRPVRVRIAAPNLDGTNARRARARLALCRRHDLRRIQALAMGDIEQRTAIGARKPERARPLRVVSPHRRG